MCVCDDNFEWYVDGIQNKSESSDAVTSSLEKFIGFEKSNFNDDDDDGDDLRLCHAEFFVPNMGTVSFEIKIRFEVKIEYNCNPWSVSNVNWNE